MIILIFFAANALPYKKNPHASALGFKSVLNARRADWKMDMDAHTDGWMDSLGVHLID